MKTRIWMACMTCVVFGIALSGVQPPTNGQDKEPNLKPPKWEYMTLGPRANEENLNKYGQDGWELVSVTESRYGTTAYLKRIGH